jgi:hypothetical protein
MKHTVFAVLVAFACVCGGSWGTVALAAPPASPAPKSWGPPAAHATVTIGGVRHYCRRWFIHSKPGPTILDLCVPWPAGNGA